MLKIAACLVLFSLDLSAKESPKPASVQELAAQLKSSPQDEALRARLFAAARRSKPALPDEAIRFEGRAEAAVKGAKAPGDYQAAAAEYRKAIEAAPWVARYYYNLGLVLEKAGQPSDAVVELKRYLAAAGRPADEVAVKKKIAGLEYTAEQQAKQTQAAAAARAQDELIARAMVGSWKNPCVRVKDGSYGGCFQGGYRLSIQSEGTKVRAEVSGTAYFNTTYNRFQWNRCGLPYFEAEVKNGRLIGTKNSIAFADTCSNIGSEPMDEAVRVEAGRFFTRADGKQEEEWEPAY